jgi:hypothetical protein
MLGNLAHWLLSCLHVRTESMVIYVRLGLMWKQLGEVSVTEFYGHDNVGNWLKVEYQPWSTWNHASTDQRWEFSVYKLGLWALCLWPRCGPVCLEWVFVVHILLVNYMSKLTDMCLMRAQSFQMVGPTRNTPNGFDTSGNGDLPPPPPMTLVETFMAAQTEVFR